MSNHRASCECSDCEWGEDACDEVCICPDIEDGFTEKQCPRCNDTE